MVTHRRSCSLSSLDSFLDFGPDESESVADNEYAWVDVDGQKTIQAPPPPPPEWTPRPLRRRLGAEEAIIAASSPEIKALDLPLTPSFPRRQKHRRELHKNAQSSPASIKSSATENSFCHKKNESFSASPLPPLCRKEIHMAIPPVSPSPSSFKLFCDNKENSVPSCISIGNIAGTKKSSASRKLKHGAGRKVFANRSNLVHPNHSSPPPKSLPIKSQQTPTTHRRRPSTDSLPSSDHLGDGLISSKQHDLPSRPCLGTIRGETRPRIVRRDRCLNVTTAFR